MKRAKSWGTEKFHMGEQSGKASHDSVAELIKLGAEIQMNDSGDVISVNLRSNARINDAGLENVSGLTKLEELVLSNTKITDAGWEHLKGFTNLRQLFLNFTSVTESARSKLQEALPN